MDFLPISPNIFVENQDFNGFGCAMFEGTHDPRHNTGGDFYFNPILLSQQYTEQATNNAQPIQLASTTDDNYVVSLGSNPVRPL
jgi:hypothetical protein